MSLVWEIKFPTLSQKVTLLKLADHATDEGEGVFPANDSLAYQLGSEKRSVQRWIKSLEQAELIMLVHRGGNGPGDTNRWQINVDNVIALALREKSLEGQNGELRLVDKKDDNLPPSIFARVTRAAIRVQSTTHKGDTDVTRTTNNHQLEPSGACARGSQDPPAALARAKPRLRISKNDAQWSRWMEHLHQKGDAELLDTVVLAGEVEASSRWPGPDVEIFTKVSKPQTNLTNRIIGEGK
jgi:hypothetical protein